MTTSISLGSRTYTVEQNTTNELAQGGYILTGPRGARYALVRRNSQPEIMFAVQMGGRFPKTSPIFKGHLFTDKDGELSLFRR
jgi:hypothetical protein